MHYVMLYPQNGDRIVAIDYVTLLHPMYTADIRIEAAVAQLLCYC